jgi:hypothetical protein
MTYLYFGYGPFEDIVEVGNAVTNLLFQFHFRRLQPK